MQRSAVAVGTRARLIAEAEALVRKRGYAGFSYADLADTLSLSKASIHHHFRTKEDLGAALIASYGQRYDAALKEIFNESESAIARIEAYARLYFEGLKQDQGCLCGVMACERDILPESLRAGIMHFFAGHLAWLERVLEDGIRNKTAREDLDPFSHARLVLSTLQGALMLGHLSGERRAFDAAVCALVKGLR